MFGRQGWESRWQWELALEPSLARWILTWERKACCSCTGPAGDSGIIGGEMSKTARMTDTDAGLRGLL